MKTCTKCHEAKPLIDFSFDLRKPDSHMPRCKRCRLLECAAWRQSKPDYEKDRYLANPKAHRERHLIRKYGVTIKDYESMFLQQMGLCAICGKSQERAFDVDHDHLSKVVRGLLCTNCNRMIGHAHDSPERLRAAADYLESSRKSRKSS